MSDLWKCPAYSVLPGRCLKEISGLKEIGGDRYNPSRSYRGGEIRSRGNTGAINSNSELSSNLACNGLLVITAAGIYIT